MILWRDVKNSKHMAQSAISAAQQTRSIRQTSAYRSIFARAHLSAALWSAVQVRLWSTAAAGIPIAETEHPMS